MTTATYPYKGRVYRVLYVGPTQSGCRAHLQEMDGSFDFWIGDKAIDLNPGAFRCPWCKVIADPIQEMCELCGGMLQ
jgi:hypothetical protein